MVAAATATARTGERTGSRLAGRYVLVDKLGAGGMGAVYRVRDEVSGKTLAFKQLLSTLAGRHRKLVEAMFEREYHTLARLKHPRVIEVYDYGLTESGPYYTMELLDGQDLHRLAPLPYREACAHLRDVASLLALLQAHRLVHRDVSPRNVRLTQDGRAKLIDFGALHAFGVASEIVGTPPCVAPEAVRRMPLDQRTDLYSLGAVAYWALTGRHAYPARTFDELPPLWERTPVAPSKLVPGVPPELDTLVLSLLHVDPIARPSSPAAVIDELTAIGELAAEEHELAAQSYLQSSQMVGRDPERSWVDARITRTLSGKGVEVVLGGPPGIGRTRLLHELALQAQLKGMAPLKADAETLPGPFALAAALSLQLLAAAGDVGRQAAAPHAAVLAHISPELKDALGVQTPAALPDSDIRMQVQLALQAWFVAVAEQRCLLLAIDNLQAADDGSAAFIATLGHEAPHSKLLVLATQRDGDAVAAAAPVRALRKRAAHLKLGSLSRDACAQLVQSLFGDVTNAGRVAKLLYQRSGGNPRQLLELAQLLVSKKIARYAGGTWVLPMEIAAHELPRRAEELVEARVRELPPAARELAEILSVHGRPIPLQLCLQLSEQSESETHAALDALVVAQLGAVEDGHYRFVQETVRETLRAQMDDATRRRCHLRAGRALQMSADDQLSSKVRAAQHLMHAGQESEGAELLARSVHRFATPRFNESVDEVIEALDAAVAVYEKQGRGPHELSELMFPLMSRTFQASDFRLGLKHAERALQVGVEISGLDRAYRLHRLLGRKLALVVGLGGAAIRFARAKKKHALHYDLRSALTAFASAVPSAVACFMVSHDTDGVVRCRDRLVGFSLFSPDELPSMIWVFVSTQLLISQGRHADVTARFGSDLAHVHSPKIAKALGEYQANHLHASMLMVMGNLESYATGPNTLDICRQVDAMLGHANTGNQGTDRNRLVYHAYRGESELRQYYHERVERFAIQGTSMWQVELSLPSALLQADAVSGDTIAVRRAFEQLTRLGQDIPHMRPAAQVAQGVYLSLRGQLAQAIACFEQALPAYAPHHCNWWVSTRAYFADALTRAGRPAEAKQLLGDALAQLHPDEFRFIVECLEAQRQLALAEAALGNRAEAKRQLDALLAQYAEFDNPLYIGLLHKARAEVALGEGDSAEFEARFADMERRFRATKNPALAAQCERLNERAVTTGLRTARVAAASSGAADVGGSALHTIGEIEAALDPFEYALRLVVQRVQAHAGYLYLFDHGELRLMAASSRDEANSTLLTQLRHQVERADFDVREEQGVSQLDRSAVYDGNGGVVSAATAAPATTPRPGPNPAPESSPDGDEESTRFEAPVERATSLATRLAASVSADDDGGTRIESMRPAQDSLGPRDEAGTVIVEAVHSAAEHSGRRVVVLRTHRGTRTTVVGGLIVEAQPEQLSQLTPALIEMIAEALHARAAALTQ